MNRPIRRIVTGMNAAGKSVVVQDSPSPVQFDVLNARNHHPHQPYGPSISLRGAVSGAS